MSKDEKSILDKAAIKLNELKLKLTNKEKQISVSTVIEGVSRLSFGTKELVNIFTTYSILNKGSEGKLFTTEIFNLNKKSIAAILRGLFTADGTVANYGNKSQYISLDSCSLSLLKQVQLLLLSFGIKAKIYENRRNGQTTSILPDGKGGSKEYLVKEMFSLRISRTSRKIFEKEIGFDLDSSKSKILTLINKNIKTYKDKLEDNFESLTYLGNEQVYDLTEPETNHFIANGIVIHNCSEFMFLDNTACNLASLNLTKFLSNAKSFNIFKFKSAIDVFIIAQDIIVDLSGYPTSEIAKNSHDFRPLGLGYSNLGALLMCLGLPYNSETGRGIARAITSLMTGQAYTCSKALALNLKPLVGLNTTNLSLLGYYPGYTDNSDDHHKVIFKHYEATNIACRNAGPSQSIIFNNIITEANSIWEILENAHSGYRNSQVTVLAPTGTIGFLMDCDTTGIEPELSLIKYKKMVGGGYLKIVNHKVREALITLGYSEEKIGIIEQYIWDKGCPDGCLDLKSEHLPVFDTSLKPENGTRFIPYKGHLRMMAVVQPFISGAISKTINMPNSSTIEDIEEAYIQAWKLNLKAVAIYRDGSKGVQPLNVKKEESSQVEKVIQDVIDISNITDLDSPPKAIRHKLKETRNAFTHRFSIGGHDGYLTVGLYPNGEPGEIFITVSKEGSTVSGFMDCFATVFSMALQHGVPLKTLIDKLAHTRFEPSGWTGNPDIGYAKSIMDYIARWLKKQFLDVKQGELFPELTAKKIKILPSENEPKELFRFDDSPPCPDCGNITERSGSCYRCPECGSTTGCS